MDNFLGGADGQMQCRGMLHIVEAGDTLYKIARKYGVPLSRVIYANPYVNVYNLQAGDEICVPVMMPRMPAQAPLAGRTDQMQTMPQNQMGGMNPKSLGSQMGGGAMPDNRMGFGAMPGSQMGKDDGMPDRQRESTQTESQLEGMEPAADDLHEETQETRPQGEQIVLTRETGVQERDYFEEMQETDKIQQSEELQQAYENASSPIENGKPERMPWENTVVTESMMEDYLSVSR